MGKPFDIHDKEAVVAAVYDTDPATPVRRAVTARVEALSLIFSDTTLQSGPHSHLEVPRPTTAIEAVALDIVRAYLSEFPEAPEITVLDQEVQ